MKTDYECIHDHNQPLAKSYANAHIINYSIHSFQVVIYFIYMSRGKPACLRIIKLKPEKNIRLFKGSQSHPINIS